MKTVNPVPAAREIVAVLARHEIPVALIDTVFAEAKSIANNNSFAKITAQKGSPTESDGCWFTFDVTVVMPDKQPYYSLLQRESLEDIFDLFYARKKSFSIGLMRFPEESASESIFDPTDKKSYTNPKNDLK